MSKYVLCPVTRSYQNLSIRVTIRYVSSRRPAISPLAPNYRPRAIRPRIMPVRNLSEPASIIRDKMRIEIASRYLVARAYKNSLIAMRKTERDRRMAYLVEKHHQ